MQFLICRCQRESASRREKRVTPSTINAVMGTTVSGGLSPHVFVSHDRTYSSHQRSSLITNPSRSRRSPRYRESEGTEPATPLSQNLSETSVPKVSTLILTGKRHLKLK